VNIAALVPEAGAISASGAHALRMRQMSEPNAAQTASRTLERDPALDGVRGVAVLLVLFHHCVIWSGISTRMWLDREIYRLANSAWLGVDLFFVLSGFLITGVLLEAKGSPAYFRNFYGRRVLRIFPLYFAFLSFAILFFPRWLPAEPAANLVASQGWYWLFISNLQVAAYGWQEPLHLGHLWSLAVEEQFYLLWPLAVFMLGRTALMRLALGCFVTALLIRILRPFEMTHVAAYVLLPTRMDGLAAGAFVALAMRDSISLAAVKRWSAGVLAASVLVLAAFHINYRFLDVDEPVIATVAYTFTAAGFAALVALVVTAADVHPLRRMLSARILTAAGRYSYGIYVVHVPIILFLSQAGLEAGLFRGVLGSSLPGVAVFCIVATIATVSCAVVSFHLIEAPFLRLKRLLPQIPHPRSAIAGSPG
jgi:peptidoglycan/LPS O-acetylase OafA/YrhL